MTKTPQETGCTTIEMQSEGHANGVVTMLDRFYTVEYDEERDAYVVGDR